MDILKQHHSLSDWDYRSGAYIEEATDQYVSPPSSLRTQENAPEIKLERLYLKDALAHNVADGRIISSHRFTSHVGVFQSSYFFRCQDTPEDADPQNCYYLSIHWNEIALYKRVAGAPSALHAYSLIDTFNVDTWYRFRLTFYQYIEDDLHKYLRIQVEQWDGSQWIDLGTYAHWDNLWADTGINRLGISLRTNVLDRYAWLDDTEIWEKP